jgi:hypothetical protein
MYLYIMSIKDLQPLQPISPFYPPFIPTGQETPTLLMKAIRNSSTVLAIGNSQVLVVQDMGLSPTATIVYFTVQQVAQNAVSCPTFSPSIKFLDVNYDGTTGDMTWYIQALNLAVTNRPVCLCTVYYYL